jgi:hypothetical protein
MLEPPAARLAATLCDTNVAIFSPQQIIKIWT